MICLAAGVALIVASLPFVGVSAYVDYLKLVRNLSDLTGVPNNLDLGSTAARLGLGGAVASVALLAGYATAVGAVLLSLRRDREVSFMVTLGATLLLSPLLQDHFLVSALIPPRSCSSADVAGARLADGWLLWCRPRRAAGGAGGHAGAVPGAACRKTLRRGLPGPRPPRSQMQARTGASKRTTAPA